MASERDELEHESLQDTDSIVRYLQELAEGIKNGAVFLANSRGELTLRPTGLLKFALKAACKRDRSRLSIKLSWRTEPRGPTGEIEAPGPLVIQPQKSERQRREGETGRGQTGRGQDEPRPR
ncbi:MAG: amphi-Trp domain-containing protein [Planctomycetota bacterium]